MTDRPESGRPPLSPPLTLGAALDAAAQLLGAATPAPRLDAEVLVRHATGVGRAELVAHPERALDPAACTALARLVARRRGGEPIAYLVGRREFWSLDIAVTPATLIPRPETELLVERALARVPTGAKRTAVDLGTGSGAVALALARERPRLEIIATDRSADTLAVARANARRIGLANLAFVLGDWFAPLARRRFDVVVSNPPYVRSDDPRLAQSELRFEPRVALDGGADGLDAVRRLVAGARAHLKPGGWLFLEHGFDQGSAIRGLFGAHGYAHVRTARDLAGHERVTEGRAPAA